MSDRCEHFKKTGIKGKNTPEQECGICPLRNKTGECIKDIMDDKSLEIETEISEIWRRFYEKSNSLLER